ncbi:plasma membrane fusion protein prm1 [Lobosporangium transversale]|uniref:Plasma membrane fusion protein PRM1 n=1 Tax=Lobosporangium transversale TaxID=64571 RepID=A0A1Y2GP83_9FUNG|nr:hypothetical protein BCR41DRAFT_395697 [Lobosporangium transversale]KAF9898500.1 plasma membrane fusion protein prm1 [Lobosporangium transversale]ORZ17416.1 hypothetical protein BCR41DRAFT_395697 [Lobosporangium transversale]|eukprot:XP_021881803.1 hypothetical protein BCR41DRAFT_395697 [Lobosporangium transversale]
MHDIHQFRPTSILDNPSTHKTDTEPVPMASTVPKGEERTKLAIAPSLGLCAKLSHTIASYTVIFLLISAYRLYQTRSAVETFALQAKQTFAKDCYALEDTITTFISMPQFASQAAHRGLVTSLDAMISQIGYGLVMVINGIIATLEFAVGLLTGTWRCFLDNIAKIEIPLLTEVGLGGIEAIDQVNKVLIGLLVLPLNELQIVIQGKMADPQVDLVLQMSKAKTRAIISTSQKKIIFCDKALQDLVAVDTFTQELQYWIRIGTYLMVAAALIVIIGNMVWTIYSHRRWKMHVERIQDRLTAYSLSQQQIATSGISVDSKPCAIQISQMVRNPLMYRFTHWSAKRIFPRNKDHQHLYNWFISYITQPQAVVCLVLGLMGLIMIYSQVIFINYMRTATHHYYYGPMMNRAATSLTELSITVSRQVNDAISSHSTLFATGVNDGLLNIETELNTHVFDLIAVAARRISAALIDVERVIVDGVRSVFGEDNVFEKVTLTVLQCLLFNRMMMIESGLSWVQHNARLELPRVSENILMVNSTEINRFVAETLHGAALFDRLANAINTNKEDKGAIKLAQIVIEKVLLEYERKLHQDLPIYYALMSVWCAIVLMGLLAVMLTTSQS